MARIPDNKGTKSAPKAEVEDVADLHDVPTQPDPPPEAKAARCEACDERFISGAAEKICSSCEAKAALRRSASRAGHVKCIVKGLGSVKAHGFKEDGSLKTEWQGGEQGEFAKADVQSLPELLVPVDG